MRIRIRWRKVGDKEQCYASASLGGSRGMAASGASEAEAIGNLILDDENIFGIEIEREPEKEDRDAH